MGDHDSGHDGYAVQGTDGINVVVPHSGHYIQMDRPGIVLGFVTLLVNEARGKRCTGHIP